MSDQHRADCYGFEGRKVRTPHLDLLARQGTRFTHCITPNVVCMPSRSAILTGMLPLTSGVHDNGIDLDESIAAGGFAGSLSKAGYDTRFIGKAHFSSNHSYANRPTGRCENIPSSHLFADDWSGPYMGFEQVELMQLGHNYWLPEASPGGLHYERWYHRDGLGAMKNALYSQSLDSQTQAAQTHNSALPTAWHNSTWVGDRTVDFIAEQGRRQRTAADAQATAQPFCAWVSMADPHHPFDAPAPWCWMHRPEEVDLPAHRTRDLDKRPWWHRAALENTPGGTPESRKVREEYSRMPAQSDAQLREIIANYYGMISLVDHQVGRILSALDDAGLAENTLVHARPRYRCRSTEPSARLHARPGSNLWRLCSHTCSLCRAQPEPAPTAHRRWPFRTRSRLQRMASGSLALWRGLGLAHCAHPQRQAHC
jgi:arylsulfatase A-like enzyme